MTGGLPADWPDPDEYADPGDLTPPPERPAPAPELEAAPVAAPILAETRATEHDQACRRHIAEMRAMLRATDPDAWRARSTTPGSRR